MYEELKTINKSWSFFVFLITTHQQVSTKLVIKTPSTGACIPIPLTQLHLSNVSLNWKPVLPRWYYFHCYSFIMEREESILLALWQFPKSFTHWLGLDHPVSNTVLGINYWLPRSLPIFTEGYSKLHSYSSLNLNSICFSPPLTAPSSDQTWSLVSPKTIETVDNYQIHFTCLHYSRSFRDLHVLPKLHGA